ncbi:hypothetical protein IPA_04235 [Ignicoccus pacificus DSM 13166]|uniref:Thaumarchaeal output domain-containing protein n=1 Tax=Ignicoccus pacificus DSM 13166 TaxID=940294 RepID=A0A977KB18_9CREN|nr:hypothetical protein IPA_04235 [Ignicoccus pacificus DSM 13166]
MSYTSAVVPLPKEVVEEIVHDPIIRKILITIFRSGTITPQIGLESGVKYPLLDEIPNWKQVIEKLIKYKLVEKRVTDRLIHCPRCGSIHVASKLLCPWCKSFNIESTYIIQHTLCGYIDTETRFRDPNTGELICPKCKRHLRKEGLDYVVIGKVFECLNCKRKTNKPLIVFQCRSCNHQFDYLSAVYEPVYEYTLTPIGTKMVTSGMLFKEEIVSALKELGMTVEAPGKERGRSGIEHTFDIIARTPSGKVLAIDFVEERDPSVAITSRIPKALDTNVDRYIIILPSGALEASMFVQMKNVIVLDLTEPYLVERIVNVAKELLRSESRSVEVQPTPLPEEEEFFGLGEEEKLPEEQLLSTLEGTETKAETTKPESAQAPQPAPQPAPELAPTDEFFGPELTETPPTSTPQTHEEKEAKEEKKEEKKKEEELLTADEFFGG